MHQLFRTSGFIVNGSSCMLFADFNHFNLKIECFVGSFLQVYLIFLSIFPCKFSIIHPMHKAFFTFFFHSFLSKSVLRTCYNIFYRLNNTWTLKEYRILHKILLSLRKTWGNTIHCTCILKWKFQTKENRTLDNKSQ